MNAQMNVTDIRGRVLTMWTGGQVTCYRITVRRNGDQNRGEKQGFTELKQNVLQTRQPPERSVGALVAEVSCRGMFFSRRFGRAGRDLSALLLVFPDPL